MEMLLFPFGEEQTSEQKGMLREEEATRRWLHGRGERKERRQAYRRGDPPEGRASCRVGAAERRTARPPPPACSPPCRSGGAWRRKGCESRGGRVMPGRPYLPIGSTGFSSKWAISHLRPTRWTIDLTIMGRASDPMGRPGPFSS